MLVEETRLIARLDPGSVFPAVMVMVIFASHIHHDVEMRRSEQTLKFIMIQDSIRDITDKEFITLLGIEKREKAV